MKQKAWIVSMIIAALFVTSCASNVEQRPLPDPNHEYDIRVHMQTESEVSEAPIYIDGKPVRTKYFLQDGHLMVPGLFFKFAGLNVEWNDQYKSLVLWNDKMTMGLPSGKKYSDYYLKTTNKWYRDYLPTAVTDLKYGTFIPLYYAARKFGMTATYNPKLYRTDIETKIQEKPKIFMSGNPEVKTAALTFDDGPEAKYTPQILDILKEKNVKATFFVVGAQSRYFPDMLKRIAEEGHEIANHTWTHPRLPDRTTADVVQEVKSTQAEVQKTTGQMPKFFRPPYGFITNADLFAINKLGLQVVNWSVDTLDWTGKSDVEILNIVERDITPGGIVLQHNIDMGPGVIDGSVKALPQMIDRLRERGYEFVTISTILNGAAPKPITGYTIDVE